MITGDADYMLKICTRDLHSFSGFLQELAATNLVASTRSSIVVEERKSTTALPVELSVQTPAGRHTPGGRGVLRSTRGYWRIEVEDAQGWSSGFGVVVPTSGRPARWRIANISASRELAGQVW